LKLVGGVDISFIKGNDVDALAMLVVLSYPTLEVVYEASEMVQLTAPYISGFLAFREAPHLLQLLHTLKREQPALYPDVLFVDGNGVLHPARLGLASYVGVAAGLPTIGIGKKLINVDGLSEKYEHGKKKVPAGLTHEVLIGASGRVWGAAVISEGSRKPVLVVSFRSFWVVVLPPTHTHTHMHAIRSGVMHTLSVSTFFAEFAPIAHTFTSCCCNQQLCVNWPPG